MIEDRPRQNQAVEQGDSQAYGHALFQLLQGTAGGGAVNIELVARSAIGRGNDISLAVSGKADVANESFIEDFVSDLAIVDTELWFACDASTGSGSVGLGHGFLRRVDGSR